MENKSLNVFNSRLVLASPTTATDVDYAAIEGRFRAGFFPMRVWPLVTEIICVC